MKQLLLLAVFLPVTLIAQNKRSLSVRKLFDQGVELYNAGKPDEALHSFEQCVSEDPTFSEAYLNISFIYLDRKDYAKALENSKSALKNNRFQPGIYTQTGKCFYYLEEYDSSIFYLKQGISFGAKNESDYLYLAKSQASVEQYRESTFNFSKAIEINPNNVSAFNERGSAYFNLGEYELARADFEKAIQLNPQSISSITNLANVLLVLDENDLALEYIDKGIANASGNNRVQLLILKGNYYKNTGNLEQASQAYEEAYTLDQENAVILNNQASVLIDLEDYEGALAKCNMALEIQPEMMEAYFNRGIAHEMLRNVEEACIDWEQAFILGSELSEEYLNSPICNE